MNWRVYTQIPHHRALATVIHRPVVLPVPRVPFIEIKYRFKERVKHAGIRDSSDTAQAPGRMRVSIGWGRGI